MCELLCDADGLILPSVLQLLTAPKSGPKVAQAVLLLVDALLYDPAAQPSMDTDNDDDDEESPTEPPFPRMHVIEPHIPLLLALLTESMHAAGVW